MAEHYSSFDRGGRRWLFQRLTAVFLVGVLAFHFMLLHFVNHAADLTFLGTQARMNRPWYLITMWLFLVTATFHGVNGVYNALVNQGLTGSRKNAVKYLLGIAGILLIVQGTRVSLAMTTLV
ncbi:MULTISPECIES: succinate dehydrogenase hydrophobic membrane anchor subunit [Haloarcula]|uniref:Succinate dehydrogenase n=4 Tax=Haloarcula TaxID=2237 RepID=A0A482T3U4_HALHI|nr:MULTISPECIES: succinate dehydrogenase hydrophobic membrane anchor subunit [Haloarcula]AEM57307.1 succinate dehydrogenase, subunit D (membrane anchor protein) [Haloarcula hispanica ATCC 33960]AHB66074.1 succinate dehydrogenase [Haloarcula hispanica N601]AJF27203.1 succinate dehydrogenase [Haloarcula sp. CBA1115]EMA22702.1 succinate dehydrogenase subunit D [Haloarcula amylolytica JCM 13557]KAA9406989.1 succinate dehydrogenase [Haloarcula sp. CBA1131]